MSASRSPAGLRSLLQCVARYPGTLFQPLLVEGVASGRDFRSEVRAIADAEGVRVFQRFEEVSDLALGERGIALLAAADLRDLSSISLVGIPPGCQVLIWSGGRAPEIPAEISQWIDRGMRYRAPRFEQGGMHEAVSSTMAHCLRRPGRHYNPVVLVTGADDVQRQALDIGIRFRAGGLRNVQDVVAPFSADRWGARQAPAQGTGLVVRMVGYRPESESDSGFLYALEQAHAVPVQIVLIMDADTEATLERHANWRGFFERGVVIKLVGGAEIDVASHGAETLPLRAVLAGRPPQAERRQSVLEGSIAKIPLGDALQFVAMSAHTGRLVVFTEHEVGFIDFQHGRIIHAGPAERWTSVLDNAEVHGVALHDGEALRCIAEQVIEDRIVEIAEWDEARFAFIAREVAPPLDEMVSLEPQGVMLTIARRQDEWPHLARRVGGLGRVWTRVEGNAPTSDGLEHRLWAALDGQRTLGEAARLVGVTRFDAAAAVEGLTRGNHISFVKDVPAEGLRDESAGSAVVRTLWAEGLITEAAEVGETLLAAHPDSASLHYQMAWLHIERREWEHAVHAFDIARSVEARDHHCAAAMNAALIGVRYLGRNPEDALVALREAGVVDYALSEGGSACAAGTAEIAALARRHDLAERLIALIPVPEVAEMLTVGLAGF